MGFESSPALLLHQSQLEGAASSDVNMRRALSYFFRLDGFNNRYSGRDGVLNPGTHIPNPMWGAPPKALRANSYDLDKAKHHSRLVKEKAAAPLAASAPNRRANLHPSRPPRCCSEATHVPNSHRRELGCN